MLSEFKTFIMRGNVLDLAVGVIIGGAFTGIVKSLTNNLISPIITFFTGGTSDLQNLKLVVTKELTFKYGAFLNDVINFLITAFVVFLLVKFVNRILRTNKKEEVKANPELEVLAEIRDLLEAQKKA
ncbi:large-conductance mechanosensitive channel protein MscL [Leuconostoc citreum]|jgi:large conductance mechanosensitive channel|uniref:Large-conductance mechanosensitive channel n=2 Tax=Leuconostoc citreum TaxID=33964 RepID=MSCL_LEUCK|nr:large-conductance mechanosensitive channel protein MscL [Leuconostoc citreum]B1MZU9.1 RecName: Full=Large-conductance mechanosensitive channel [Leuconostoc citreum KM20]ACA83051.1 Large conductance mechanosensitive channel protein [Leuconostoc citreum KM20]KAF0260988.1 large conductance mechanosensitive channel protein MscL [Leuconostoc citreum]MBA5938902.1 large-conductance mechanosensitive channel protein MscL [Leuconostoc citreum]MBE4726009.1 large-conductance mechanosensitive channel pr